MLSFKCLPNPLRLVVERLELGAGPTRIAKLPGLELMIFP